MTREAGMTTNIKWYNSPVTIKFRKPCKKELLGLLAAPVVVIVTGVVIFFGQGFHFSLQSKTIEKTGMLVVKSFPDGAKIYIDNEWKSATPDTFSNLRPKSYLLKAEKEGFSTWEKQVTVYPELVTDITAVLVSTTPKLEPLTVGGAKNPSYSEATKAIAYGTTDSKAGLWVLPMGRPLPITLFQSAPTLVMPDNLETKYSDAWDLLWSPTGDQILVKISDEDFRLIDISQSKELLATDSAKEVSDKWQKEQIKKRQAFLEKQDITPELATIATKSDTIWSPDERKFFYFEAEGEKTTVFVHNMEKPIPVDEKIDYKALEFETANPPTVIWYTDSYHLITKEGNSLYLTRIDGTNKTEIYSGVMDGDTLFVTPDGNKVVISASFKKDAPPELYAVSLR